MNKRGRPKHPDILTPREWEVLALVRDELSNEQIAERLGISIDGVKYHVSEILTRLGLADRIEVARWYDRITYSSLKLVSERDWRTHPALVSFKTIVDIGGGNGDVLKAILTAKDDAEGILFDLPSVVDRAKSAFANTSVVGRVSFESGNFFSDQIPDGGDAYVLHRVLVDWGDEQSVHLLKRCRSAMSEDGRVLTVEKIISEGSTSDSLVQLLLRGQLAHELMRIGDQEEAIEQLETSVALIHDTPRLAGDRNMTREHLRLLGLVHLQLAEDQNCIDNHNATSCILPLRDEAVHASGSVALVEARRHVRCEPQSGRRVLEETDPVDEASPAR